MINVCGLCIACVGVGLSVCIVCPRWVVIFLSFFLFFSCDYYNNSKLVEPFVNVLCYLCIY